LNLKVDYVSLRFGGADADVKGVHNWLPDHNWYTAMVFYPVSWIRIRIALSFKINPDPDPGFRIQGFDDQKLKKIQPRKKLIFFDQKLPFLLIPRPP
jgi:hypothetical protein